MSPTFVLNETSLVFLPRTKSYGSSVFQITLYAKEKQNTTVEVLACYYLYQHQISELVAKILVLHNEQPLPNTTLFVGDEYTLLAERKPWKLGEKWRFQWGNEDIEPAEDKWTFSFRLTNEEMH